MGIYLDNAATTFPKPEQVYRAVDRTFREIGIGPGRGGYARGIQATRLVFEARETLAQFFGVADSARLVFTHSATESLNLAVGGLLRSGDHVVTSSMEHNSLVRPLYRAAQNGIEVTWVQGDGSGLLDSRRIGSAIRPNTRLVAISHCSNVTGTIQPVEEIALLARKSGAFFLLDAAQSAGGFRIDVREMMVDLLAAPGHKGLFGPQGTGLLYIADRVELTPLLVGGTGGQSAGPDQPSAMPERFESGTLNTPGIAGLKAGAEFLLETGLAAVRKKETDLVRHLLAGLRSIPGVTVYGPETAEERCGVVSFSVEGFDPSRIGFHLDTDYGICVRVGLHCAFAAHKTIGTYPEGTVRVSPGYFNTDDEMETFLKALRAIVIR